MALTKEQVSHIATLCRIGMTDEDRERFGEQLNHILEQFEVLRQVDTTEVPPTSQSLELENAFRDDVPGEPFAPGQVLLNAPASEDGYIRVRAVLED